jgi:hypothetical protein
MRVLFENMENTVPCGGLSCVWESAREGERTRLVARWINPDADGRRSRTVDSIDCDEARTPWLGISLQLA